MYLNVCEKCGKPRTYISVLTGEAIPCLCDCEKKRMAEEEREEAKRQRMLLVSEFRSASLLGARFSKVKFENTETGSSKSFDEAFNRCKRYCEKSGAVFDGGYGLYIYGDKGTGKTHLAACIVNELSEQLVPSVFTNFGEIAKLALKSPSSFERLCEVDFLVIDDVGAQRVRGKDGDFWLQEKAYEVINSRYNDMLPTIFTSNYSLGDLVTECGVAARTVDRIAEMSSAVLKITGKSRRIDKKCGELPF